jgi:methyl-accepting chemotaxis protein
MTIARRLIVLLAIPLLVLLALGIISLQRLARIEDRSRFLAEDEIESVAALGNISRSFAELRVNLRSFLLTEDAEERARARALFEADREEVSRLLRLYADRLVSNDQERRLLDEYRGMSGEWIASGATRPSRRSTDLWSISACV